MKNIIGIVAEKLGHSLSPYIHNYWCEKYNISAVKFDKTQLNLRRFGSYFEDIYKNRRLTKVINDMEIKYSKLRGEYKNPNKDVINVTTRMTICEDKV